MSMFRLLSLPAWGVLGAGLLSSAPVVDGFSSSPSLMHHHSQAGIAAIANGGMTTRRRRTTLAVSATNFPGAPGSWNTDRSDSDALEDADPEQANVDRKRAQVQERLLQQQQLRSSGTSQAAAATSSTFELTLTKPLGFSIAENVADGTVVVTAIHEDYCSRMVQYAVRPGDRVVAVDSTFGDKLWPVSTVEGVISACTSRLPGQQITFRFERPLAAASGATETTEEQAAKLQQQEQKQIVAEASLSSLSLSQAAAATTTSAVAAGASATASASVDPQELLRRCRQVLTRYLTDQKGASTTATTTPTAMMKNNVIPGLVADKVVDALTAAAVPADAGTLSLLMKAYRQSNQPRAVLDVFEQATGFAADGSVSTPKHLLLLGDDSERQEEDADADKPKYLRPSEAALNLVTGTSLMQAHAALGDMGSVRRVLAALEGRSSSSGEETTVGGKPVAPWPWTGTFGSIQPDTVCYNVALAAAEKTGSVQDALELFQRMKPFRPTTAAATTTTTEDSSSSDAAATVRGPVRDVVSYNTLISALCHAGRSDEAFSLLDEMKQLRLRPDKYTYTALIQSCWHEGDIDELLYDMKERGVQPDVILYNTLIQSLCQKRQWNAATKLITEMETRDRLAPNAMTYSFLMNAMLQADKPAACLTLFESACANERTHGLVAQQVHLYTTAITAACQLRDHERALEYVQRMQANGVQPNLQTLTAVMGACLACREYDLAASVYRRIGEPDGYAVSQGIRALCGVGGREQLQEAADLLMMRRRSSDVGGSKQHSVPRMTGKQRMLSYQTVLQAALRADEFDLGSTVWDNLLRRGFIPSRAMYKAVIEAFDINTSTVLEPSGRDQTRFQFLLHVVDSLRRRNLPLDGLFYAAVLILARQMGGAERRVGALLAQAKTCSESQAKELLTTTSLSDDGGDNDRLRASTDAVSPAATTVESWEDLLVQLRATGNGEGRSTGSMDSSSLPTLKVRVAARDARRVFRAEQAVAYNKVQSRSSNRRKQQTPQQPASTTL